MCFTCTGKVPYDCLSFVYLSAAYALFSCLYAYFWDSLSCLSPSPCIHLKGLKENVRKSHCQGLNLNIILVHAFALCLVPVELVYWEIALISNWACVYFIWRIWLCIASIGHIVKLSTCILASLQNFKVCVTNVMLPKKIFNILNLLYPRLFEGGDSHVSGEPG